MGSADVVVVTAAEKEDEAVQAVRDGAMIPWRKESGPAGFSVWRSVFSSSSGQHLTVILARAHEQRAEATATMATALVEKHHPRCLAMCGVCAGRPGWTELGDVIVADRVYRYDAGTRKDRRLATQEITTYNLNATWKQEAEAFMVPGSAVWLSERPYTLAAQSQWILNELQAGRDPKTSPQREKRCKDWPEVLRFLWSRRWVMNGKLKLTAAGRREIDRVLLLNHGAIPEPGPLSVHVGPIGTGNNLVIDDSIWDELQVTQSHIRGIDMEASAIGVVGHTFEVPDVIVVKGVMDFAERRRARHFRSFAARAAAEVLLGFLRQRLSVFADVHATALTLSVSRADKSLQLWATNSGTHVIRDIEVNAIPDAEDWHPGSHGALPKLSGSGSPSSQLNHRMGGAWFHARVAQLSPGRGVMIATGSVGKNDYTVMDFDVFWNDHEGRQRKSHCVVDVRNTIGDVPLKPRVAIR